MDVVPAIVVASVGVLRGLGVMRNPFEPDEADAKDVKRVLAALVSASREIYRSHRNDAIRDGFRQCACDLCLALDEYEKLVGIK